MNSKKYLSLKAEDVDNSMECENDDGTEKLGASALEYGTSSFDPNVASGFTLNQPSTSSGYTDRKRKSSFSSPLQTKFFRDIWNRRQRQEQPSVNETNNIEVASGFSTVSRANPISSSFDPNVASGHKLSQPSISFDPNVASGYTLSQPSTFGYTGQKSPATARISRDIWSGKQQHEDSSSLNKTNPYNTNEVASGSGFDAFLHQIMQVEQCGISSQPTRYNSAAVLDNNRPSKIELGISTDFPPEAGAGLNPNTIASSLTNTERAREFIIRFLDEEVSNFGTVTTLTDGYRLAHETKIFHIWRTYSLPESYFEPLLRHLKNHLFVEMMSLLAAFPKIDRSTAFSCPICTIFSMLPIPGIS